MKSSRSPWTTHQVPCHGQASVFAVPPPAHDMRCARLCGAIVHIAGRDGNALLVRTETAAQAAEMQGVVDDSDRTADGTQLVCCLVRPRSAAPRDFWRNRMLYYAVVFFVIALIAGVLGFGGIAGAAAGIAKILFFVFLVLFVVSLIMGRRVKV